MAVVVVLVVFVLLAVIVVAVATVFVVVIVVVVVVVVEVVVGAVVLLVFDVVVLALVAVVAVDLFFVRIPSCMRCCLLFRCHLSFQGCFLLGGDVPKFRLQRTCLALAPLPSRLSVSVHSLLTLVDWESEVVCGGGCTLSELRLRIVMRMKTSVVSGRESEPHGIFRFAFWAQRIHTIVGLGIR